MSALCRIMWVCLAACAATPGPRAELAPAAVTTDAGERVAYERGVLHVPEHRGVPSSRSIAVAFARLRGPAGSTAPPIVFLPGGPGTSYLDAFTDTTANSRRRLAMFRTYATVADVIVFDTRGHSPTGTPLVAPAPRPLPLDRPSSIAATAAQWRAYAHDLALANPGRDLGGYDLFEVAADVDALRRALGYGQITLLGTSFGSQTALAVMRRYPATVARALLSGIEPLGANFDLPSDVVAALRRIAADADRDPALAAALPPGGVMAAIDALLARFAAGPVTVALSEPEAHITLGLADLQAALMPPDDAADWPAWILALYRGDYTAWARAERDTRTGDPFLAPVNPLIDAGLGATAARTSQLHADPARRVLGDWGFAVHEATRAVWPAADLGDAYREPAPSAIPVVFVQGDWDTSTPIENARALVTSFAHGHLLVVHRGEHAQPSRLLREDPAAFAAVLEFLRTGDASRVPAETTLARPAFPVTP